MVSFDVTTDMCLGITHYRDGRDSRFADAGGIAERVTFCSKLFVDSWERWSGSVSPTFCTFLRIYKFRSLQERPTKPDHLQLVPQRWTSWQQTTFLKAFWKGEKKTKNCAERWKRKDGVEEVEESGLVNKHIFWRSAGGNALEGQGYEFMTVYDTIVSMGAESMHVTRMRSAWSSWWWWKGMGHQW